MMQLPIKGHSTALEGSMRDFRHLPGTRLLDRVDAFYEWQQDRRQAGVWPLGRSTDTGPGTRCTARSDDGSPFSGVNFASQDYLSLSNHQDIVEIAIETARAFGVHSAGSPALVGNTSLSIALEQELAQFLDMEHVALFPTGWAAGFGIIKGLVRPSDHIVMDALSHACLQEGAQAATRNIHLFRHNQADSLRDKLALVRAKDRENGVLVVTESLFSMDSDTPDIAAFQALCDEYDATLVVDVAHDLGNLGPTGRGHLEIQSMLGKVDLVMGSFSKTFASNGGFVACNKRSVKEYLRYYSSPNTFSNAMSPINAAIVRGALQIVRSPEGAQLRDKLSHNILLLRRLLGECGFETFGDPSAIVCVKMGSEALARLVSRRLPSIGLIANLVEFPAVPKGQARFRLQVMANHSQHEIVSAVRCIAEATAAARREKEALDDGLITLDVLDDHFPLPAPEQLSGAAPAQSSSPAFTYPMTAAVGR
jgi:glycine C-acetyltransferase